MNKDDLQSRLEDLKDNAFVMDEETQEVEDLIDSGELEDAGYGTEQYVVNVKAYETTTARLLGTETGYSKGREGNVKVSIEEAVNDAMNNILSRINNYWEADLKKGIQYKVIVNISSEFEEDEVEDIQFDLIDIIEKISAKSKENIVSSNVVDYLIWASPEDYDSSSKIYRAIKKEFRDMGTDGRIGKVNLNKKMILLKVSAE
jgi:superfamily II helicase